MIFFIPRDFVSTCKILMASIKGNPALSIVARFCVKSVFSFPSPKCARAESNWRRPDGCCARSAVRRRLAPASISLSALSRSFSSFAAFSLSAAVSFFVIFTVVSSLLSCLLFFFLETSSGSAAALVAGPFNGRISSTDISSGISCRCFGAVADVIFPCFAFEPNVTGNPMKKNFFSADWGSLFCGQGRDCGDITALNRPLLIAPPRDTSEWST